MLRVNTVSLNLVSKELLVSFCRHLTVLYLIKDSVLQLSYLAPKDCPKHMKKGIAVVTL